MSREIVFAEIAVERHQQDLKWGEQNHPDLLPRKWTPENHARELGILTASQAKFRCEGAKNAGEQNWGAILVEELAEAVEQAALKHKKELRAELVQCAAVVVAWIEAIDRRPKTREGTSRRSHESREGNEDDAVEGCQPDDR